MTRAQKQRAQALHEQAHDAIRALVDAYRFGSLHEQIRYAADAAEARRAALRIEANG